jgi:apolipoprotein N-acyltransferase
MRTPLRCRHWALAAASGLLLTAIYPPINLSVLAWVALAPLLLALEGASPLGGWWLGWITGTVGALGVTGYWIFRAAHDYFHLSDLAALGFTVGVTQLFVSVYFALFGLAVALLRDAPWRWLAVPAVLVATEFLRAHLLSGNPWALLGHSQTGVLLMQLSRVTGIYGMSFVLALTGTAAASLPRTRMPSVVALISVVAVLVFGEWYVRSAAHQPMDSISIALVQGNLPNAERGEPQHYTDHLDHYLELSLRAAAAHPEMIVWPENAIGFFPESNPALLERLTDWLGRQKTAVLAGAPRATSRGGSASVFNSAYLWNAGGIAGVYDKQVLLPFVERLPLRSEDGPYQPGTRATIFSIGQQRFGVLICYEAIYPALARQLVNEGAQFLVNLSNDSWFEAGAGPEQHYQLSRFRAVENGVSVVRVTNSGVSGVIDPLGRETTRLPSQSAVALVADVPIGSPGTFYSRHGDVFALACVVAALAAVVLARLRPLPH